MVCAMVVIVVRKINAHFTPEIKLPSSIHYGTGTNQPVFVFGTCSLAKRKAGRKPSKDQSSTLRLLLLLLHLDVRRLGCAAHGTLPSGGQAAKGLVSTIGLSTKQPHSKPEQTK